MSSILRTQSPAINDWFAGVRLASSSDGQRHSNKVELPVLSSDLAAAALKKNDFGQDASGFDGAYFPVQLGRGKEYTHNASIKKETNGDVSLSLRPHGESLNAPPTVILTTANGKTVLQWMSGSEKEARALAELALVEIIKTPQKHHEHKSADSIQLPDANALLPSQIDAIFKKAADSREFAVFVFEGKSIRVEADQYGVVLMSGGRVVLQAPKEPSRDGSYYIKRDTVDPRVAATERDANRLFEAAARAMEKKF